VTNVAEAFALVNRWLAQGYIAGGYLRARLEWRGPRAGQWWHEDRVSFVEVTLGAKPPAGYDFQRLSTHDQRR
jgi:hypothetical protein